MQPSILLPISLFFIKFPFSCFQLIYDLYKWNLNICRHNYLCQECLPSLLPLSSPKRCKLAETICISQNCIEICLKTPNAEFELKNTFCCCYFKKLTFKNAANKLKHDVFSKIGIQSVWKHLNPAKRQCSQSNLGQKRLKTAKKHYKLG